MFANSFVSLLVGGYACYWVCLFVGCQVMFAIGFVCLLVGGLCLVLGLSVCRFVDMS